MRWWPGGSTFVPPPRPAPALGHLERRDNGVRGAVRKRILSEREHPVGCVSHRLGVVVDKEVDAHTSEDVLPGRLEDNLGERTIERLGVRLVDPTVYDGVPHEGEVSALVERLHDRVLAETFPRRFDAVQNRCHELGRAVPAAEHGTAAAPGVAGFDVSVLDHRRLTRSLGNALAFTSTVTLEAKSCRVDVTAQQLDEHAMRHDASQELEGLVIDEATNE